MLGGAAGGLGGLGGGGGPTTATSGDSGDINYNAAFAVGGGASAGGTAPGGSGTPSWLPYALAGAGLLVVLLLAFLIRRR